MDVQRWSSLQETFDHLVDMAPEDQAHALRELSATDPAMAEEVQGLLEEDASGQQLPEMNIESLLQAALHNGGAPWPDEGQIGPYRILRLLGEGGMGVVYLAERTDIGGQVAIKLLRDAWLSPMRRQRFEIEQHTLAQLNHPSIARIYDANTLEDGTPWFVMEYAEGIPLTEHWKARGGTLRDCLVLIKRICEAVQYAHNHAIIHRDLKPSNILVNESGEVKLLDFGIAKQLNREESQDRTITGLRLMTLAYAAPEQLAGATAGLYTDVYALGVLLYELVTGRLPHRTQTGDAEDALDHWWAEKPSAVVKRGNPK